MGGSTEIFPSTSEILSDNSMDAGFCVDCRHNLDQMCVPVRAKNLGGIKLRSAVRVW